MPDSEPLRPRLVGTWRLESFVAIGAPGSSLEPWYPYGKSPSGFLVYTNDGYMSTNIVEPGQADFDWVSESHWAESAKRYTGYSGPFYITEKDGKEDIIKHFSEVSSLPAWIGTTQERTWEFEEGGRILILSSPGPMDMRVSLYALAE
ncbi:hypothetical protein EV356DRAFT_340901 [Viridothelium virens]|uniref:Lipocalin-like domain-containing protein n=1 Tax=Viridothelium virens TaxID=1048519 RepID=A0A6A6GXU2_VIRVR|nr:hypothetical protein EV356DRAFT_340901 [Viridothelium virens]